MANDKSWQARISEATDALAQSFVESISYDRRLYRQDIAGSIAHAKMLAKVGLITPADRDAIVQGLRGIEADIEAGRFAFDESLEDIHMVVEAALIERIGEPGRRLHTARSRNDQVATDFAMWITQSVFALQEQLRHLQCAFVDLADRSVDVVMPSYTHLQRAQPISAAAEALAWTQMFQGDIDRLEANPSMGQMPLGSGAIAGTSLPIDAAAARDELVDEIGRERLAYFSDSPVSSIERTASRDAACDLLFACAMIAQHLSRFAEQWIIYSSTEFSFIRIADRYTTGSSMMPQKRNPDMLELIRGRCGNVYGDLVAMLTILKGLPIGYNRDLQEDKRIAFRGFDTVSSCLTMAAAIVASASFIPQNIEPTLERGFVDATSLAEYFVTKGIPFRTAHQIVGALVARCEKEGKPALSQLAVEDFVEAAKSKGADAAGIGEDVREALGARNVVKRYRSAGAAGGTPLRQQLEAWKRQLGLS